VAFWHWLLASGIDCLPTRETYSRHHRDPGRMRGAKFLLADGCGIHLARSDFGFFKIDDGSGQLWVYSQNFGTPIEWLQKSRGGRIDMQAVNVMGRNFGMILKETGAPALESGSYSADLESADLDCFCERLGILRRITARLRRPGRPF